MGTSQHRMARHDQSRLACVGWRSSDLSTAIASRHPIRATRLHSLLKARVGLSQRAPKVAWRRTRLRSGGLGEPPLHRSADPTTSASTELGPSEPDRAPDLIIGAYERRTSNTNHVPFTSFRIKWTSGASAPECGVAGGGDGCHAGRPASIWDLRSAGRSYNGWEWCIPPLSSLRCRVWRYAPWPLGHVHSASRRPPHEHAAWHEKRRIRETRLGKRGHGDSHAEGGGACTRRTNRRTTPVRHRAPAALGRHDPAAPNAHGATPPSHRTSLALWRLILFRDMPFGGAALFFSFVRR